MGMSATRCMETMLFLFYLLVENSDSQKDFLIQKNFFDCQKLLLITESSEKFTEKVSLPGFFKKFARQSNKVFDPKMQETL